MAKELSNLVPAPENFEYMCIMGCSSSTLRMIYGDTSVMEILKEKITNFWSDGLESCKVKYGNTYQLKMVGTPFLNFTSSDDSIACKRMACAILHELHNSGWQLITSSDLSSDVFSWFYVRNHNITKTSELLCIGISNTDALQVINAPRDIREMIVRVIQSNWVRGIRKTFDGDTSVYKLHGDPWIASEEALVHSRMIILGIINELHMKGWVLQTSTNLKNTSDSLYFSYQPNPSLMTHPGSFAINVNRKGKLQVIGAPVEVVAIIQQVIQFHWKGEAPVVGECARSKEFSLRGLTSWKDGEEAISSRYLILKIFETLLPYGWTVCSAVSITRETKDKTCLIFQRCHPIQAPVFCMSLNKSETIRLINASDDVLQTCKEVIYSKWLKGVKKEKQLGPNQYEFQLSGKPWSSSEQCDGAHARGMLCFILQAFRAKNWRILISADVSAKLGSSKGEDPTDRHSWYFVYDTYLNASAPPMVGQELPMPMPTFPPQEMYQPNNAGAHAFLNAPSYGMQ